MRMYHHTAALLIALAGSALVSSVRGGEPNLPGTRAADRADRPAAILPDKRSIDVDALGEEVFSPDEIIAIMHRVNDYTFSHPWKPHDRNWIRATYYTGVMALYRTTRDERILNQALTWARQHEWQEGDEQAPANRKTCGQTYLELYFIKRDQVRIARIRAYVDRRIVQADEPKEAWYYCDTLYVAPPTLAMLGKATGQPKYYDYLHKMYWGVVDHLFDQRRGLFYRDQRFIDKTNKNGKKIFWSRGNGWVIAGIPRVLTYLPPADPYYERYVRLLRKMAASIAGVQGDDGLWRTNLADPDAYPDPETSGTAFFCYALAWGINQGDLDRAKYLPVVTKAWKGLVAAVHPSGKLGWVQRVDHQPHAVESHQTHEYAAGAFLLAGSEMVKLAPSSKTPQR